MVAEGQTPIFFARSLRSHGATKRDAAERRSITHRNLLHAVVVVSCVKAGD